MKIETKYNVGDKVFVITNNLLKEVTIKDVLFDSGERVPVSYKMVEKEGLPPYEFHIRKQEEDVFSFPEEILGINYTPVALVSDNDGHNYIIPPELKEKFYKLLFEIEENIESEESFIEIFGKFETGGDWNRQFYVKGEL